MILLIEDIHSLCKIKLLTYSVFRSPNYIFFNKGFKRCQRFWWKKSRWRSAIDHHLVRLYRMSMDTNFKISVSYTNKALSESLLIFVSKKLAVTFIWHLPYIHVTVSCRVSHAGYFHSVKGIIQKGYAFILLSTTGDVRSSLPLSSRLRAKASLFSLKVLCDLKPPR